MNDLLIVYNTCGISKRENSDFYIEALKRIVNQNFGKVCVSSCKNDLSSLLKIKDHFNIDVFSIRDHVPISVSFNFSVQKMIEKYGRFKSYLFIDSGILLTENDQVKKLYDLHNSGPYGMTCGRTQDDMGFNDWFGTDMVGDQLFNNGDLIVPIGKACNLHMQIIDDKLVSFYKRPLPDIFAGQCMESVFSFMCAALKTKWIVSKDVLVHHNTGMDGPSSGFSPAEHVIKGGRRWDHLFCKQGSILDIMSKGYDLGMGYEEIQNIQKHKAECFDKDGYGSIQLAEFIRDHLFLTDLEFSYNLTYSHY